MSGNTQNLVIRSRKVAFLGVISGSSETYKRMTGFTELSTSHNPSEYSRKYVDEDSERTDITGYSKEISYNFDQYTNNDVHDEIINITENELKGSDAVRNIVVVDFTKPVSGSDNTYYGKKKPYAIVPDADGDDENTYTYSGSLKSNGEQKDVTCTTSDDWQTITVTEPSSQSSSSGNVQ